MSSYNDFLSQIEVDEKELKRDLQSRKKENKSGVKTKASTKSNTSKSLQKLPSSKQPTKNTDIRDGLRTSYTNKNIDIQPGRSKPISKKQETVSKENSKTQKKNPRENKSQRELVENVVINNKQAVNSKLPVTQKVTGDKTAVTNLGKSQYNPKAHDLNNRNNPGIIKETVDKQKVHLRKKKVVDQFTKDKELVEKQTFSISKDEYNKKIMGSIRQQQTKLIFLRDGEKLAKAPKGVVFLGIYAFVLSIIMLFSFSGVGTVKMELRSLNAKYKELNEVNAQLNIKLATAYNIDNIRQRAENELYMSKPEAHQIMYITVVPENYVEYEMELDNE